MELEELAGPRLMVSRTLTTLPCVLLDNSGEVLMIIEFILDPMLMMILLEVTDG